MRTMIVMHDDYDDSNEGTIAIHDIGNPIR